jgi:hypothetical protein
MSALDLVFDTGKEVEISGRVNVTDEQLLANIAYAIKQGHPQIKPCDQNKDRVLVIGGGPSLAMTEKEIIDLYFDGAKVVTVNGAYHWCIERNIRPSVQIVVDARPHNFRYVEPAIQRCTYLLASQCAPETWDRVKNREYVFIWHALGEGDETIKTLLNTYYLGHWHGVMGGTTVAVRALILLRMLGFMQFDLFGIDSCWGEKRAHHAYEQPENNADKRLPVRIGPSDGSNEGKEFWVAPWHLVQFENYLNLIGMAGEAFGRITVHGDGMLAYAMHALSGDVKITEVDHVGSSL